MNFLFEYEEGNDGVILEDYNVKDLDEDTIKKYRNRFSSRNPDHPWNALDTEQFIEMLGGIKEDRRRKIKGVTVAGMLMIGKGLYIRDLFAKINFDFTVINKLTSNVKVPFRLENLERKDDTLVHQ